MNGEKLEGRGGEIRGLGDVRNLFWRAQVITFGLCCFVLFACFFFITYKNLLFFFLPFLFSFNCSFLFFRLILIVPILFYFLFLSIFFLPFFYSNVFSTSSFLLFFLYFLSNLFFHFISFCSI